MQIYDSNHLNKNTYDHKRKGRFERHLRLEPLFSKQIQDKKKLHFFLPPLIHSQSCPKFPPSPQSPQNQATKKQMHPVSSRPT